MILKELNISSTEWEKTEKSTTASWRGSAEEGWRHVVISVFTCAGNANVNSWLPGMHTRLHACNMSALVSASSNEQAAFDHQQQTVDLFR